MIKKVVEKLLVKLADNMTEKAVNSASPRFCFQPEEPEAARVKFLK